MTRHMAKKFDQCTTSNAENNIQIRFAFVIHTTATGFVPVLNLYVFAVSVSPEAHRACKTLTRQIESSRSVLYETGETLLKTMTEMKSDEILRIQTYDSGIRSNKRTSSSSVYGIYKYISSLFKSEVVCGICIADAANYFAADADSAMNANRES